MSDVRIILGDCRAALRSLADNSVDSIVCDPPYHLTAGKKGGTGPASVNLDSPAGRARITAGFMGKAWDGLDEHGVGVAFDPATWREALRVLKPGGHVLAFGGTRTYHRLACAIEDAGFEVRDMLGWLYGSGFPKSMDVSKAIDKAAGAEREVIGPSRRHGGGSNSVYAGDAWTQANAGSMGMVETAPATEAAKQWAGWGTALKPAIEPICLARKPLDGTVAANVQKWGTGALHIDGCRIDLDGELINPTGKGAVPARHDDGEPREGAPIEPRAPGLGRWPANVLLSVPADEYRLRDDVTPDQLEELAGWLRANA